MAISLGILTQHFQTNPCDTVWSISTPSKSLSLKSTAKHGISTKSGCKAILADQPSWAKLPNWDVDVIQQVQVNYPPSICCAATSSNWQYLQHILCTHQQVAFRALLTLAFAFLCGQTWDCWMVSVTLRLGSVWHILGWAQLVLKQLLMFLRLLNHKGEKSWAQDWSSFLPPSSFRLLAKRTWIYHECQKYI